MAGIALFKKPETIKILIVGDQGSVLDRLERRIDIFWPPDIPVKTTAVFCAWADEAIEAIKDTGQTSFSSIMHSHTEPLDHGHRAPTTILDAAVARAGA